MLAFAGAFEIEADASGNHFLAMLQIVMQGLFETEYTGLVVDQGQHNHAKGGLQLSVGIKLVQHHLRHGITA